MKVNEKFQRRGFILLNTKSKEHACIGPDKEEREISQRMAVGDDDLQSVRCVVMNHRAFKFKCTKIDFEDLLSLIAKC